MKKCAHCGAPIPKRQNYEKAKYCSLPCYWKSLPPFKTARNTAWEKTPENADRWFWPKVDVRDDGQCWEWTGSRTSGYGKVKNLRGQSAARAHRVSVWLATGEWPKGMVLHSCDNRACVNPKHLRVGTVADNAKDAMDRNRLPTGEGHKSSKLTLTQVREIRASSEQHKTLAERFGVHETTILRVRTRQLWKGA